MKKAGKKAAKKTAARKPTGKKTVSKKAAIKRTEKKTDSPVAAPAGVPNIDYSLCQGCGGCAEAFPHLFEMRAERAWVINPEAFDPVRDAGIMKICPYYAITIENL